MTPISTDTPLRLHLTFAYLSNQGRAPLYVGTQWKLRLQVRDENDAAKALTAAIIVMTITGTAGSVTRHTGTTSAGAPAAQVVIDADQTAEDTVNYTGKGWFTVRFDAIAADIASLVSLESKKLTYEVAIKFADLVTQVVFCAGDIDVLAPKNTFPIT